MPSILNPLALLATYPSRSNLSSPTLPKPYKHQPKDSLIFNQNENEFEKPLCLTPSKLDEAGWPIQMEILNRITVRNPTP